MPEYPEIPLYPDLPEKPDVPLYPDVPETIAKNNGRLFAKFVVPVPDDDSKDTG